MRHECKQYRNAGDAARYGQPLMNYHLTAADMATHAKAEQAAARKLGTYETTWNTIKAPDVTSVKAMAEDRARAAQILYLTALLDGPKTTRQVADEVNRQINTTGRAMRIYAEAELVTVEYRTTGSIYTITDAGREWLEGRE